MKVKDTAGLALRRFIGIRDVYPEIDLEKLRTYLYFGISFNAAITVEIILAINEIEAWFIAEENHYARISRKLSFQTANEITGIDVRTDSTESIRHPSSALKQIWLFTRYSGNGLKNGVKSSYGRTKHINPVL